MDTGQSRGHYRSRGRQSAGQYPPRRAKRLRPGPKHARRSPGALVELARAASRWLARVGVTDEAAPVARVSRDVRPRAGRRAGPRLVWLRRAWPFLASARRYSSYLSASAGLIVILFSVYLIRQGVMLPSSVPFGGGSPPAASAPDLPAADSSGTVDRERPAGAAGPASGDETPPPASDAGVGLGAGAGAAAGAGAGAAAEEPKAQPVMEDEEAGAPSAADVGPRSAGEILSLFEAPASGTVARGFGWYESPVFKDWRYHTGVDITLRTGDQVRAAGSGLVITVEGTRFEGWRVVVSHGLGITTIYSQLGSAAVAEGDSVSGGQPLGLAGASGALEADLGVHLHFEIRRDNSEIDPTPYLGR